MGLKRAVFEAVTQSTVRLLRLNGPSRVASEIAAAIDPIYAVAAGGRPIKFYSAGAWPHYRASTLLTKEPDTIRWIDTFLPDDLFYDIGANVGVYTLYAAIVRGCQVVAFEPSAVNHAVLTRNVELNGVDIRVSAFCLALDQQTRIEHLYMQTTSPGGALSTFGVPVDYRGQRFKPVFRQAVIGITLDAFQETFGLPCPQHIKIDVDGNEDRIIAGAAKTLQNPQVKSVLMELNEAMEGQRRLIEQMTVWGFTGRGRGRKSSQEAASGLVHNHLFTRGIMNFQEAHLSTAG